MFKVKATLVGALGDTETYPCHFGYKMGDEIIWTGAEYKGRICPGMLTMLAQKIEPLYNAGPRWVESSYYLPFWYSTASPIDPNQKKYDGIGFRPLLKTVEEPKMSMANIRPPGSFNYPPASERNIGKDITLVCPDYRTALVFKIEAFDIADDGDSVTYFRRMMVILNRLKNKPNTPIDKILDEFTKEEIETIHPILSPVMIQCLVEELELVGYLDFKDGKVTVTDKGKKKAETFKAGLSKEEIEALRI
jgi:uncharacterized repeat protein (TIGR04076 family)